ncbi:hypothetical protein GOP47_0028116 [Adiantum capillus-veneris]|nr:hypothetical protein GOP47_0028116 [Adiantum capillus-veneris]
MVESYRGLIHCLEAGYDAEVEAKRGEWLPGLASPAYLDGKLANDNGFNPLSLAEDLSNLKWYVQAELQNGRWAMLGVAGMLIPDLLTKIGAINVPAWYDAGKVEYFAPTSTLFVIEFILLHYVEEKEIANGRLAMLAFLDFMIQHNITGKSPVDNLFTHLDDPWHNTIIQTLQGLDRLYIRQYPSALSEPELWREKFVMYLGVVHVLISEKPGGLPQKKSG